MFVRSLCSWHQEMTHGLVFWTFSLFIPCMVVCFKINIFYASCDSSPTSELFVHSFLLQQTVWLGKWYELTSHCRWQSIYQSPQAACCLNIFLIIAYYNNTVKTYFTPGSVLSEWMSFPSLLSCNEVLVLWCVPWPWHAFLLTVFVVQISRFLTVLLLKYLLH